jgi:transcription antitermination protein NusB
MSELGAQRHRARERALEIAYEATMKERAISAVLAELPLAPDDYTVDLLEKLENEKVAAEALISRFSIDWSLDRMSVVDRLIMSLAIAEFALHDAPPRAVILDEAVELAKTFSSESAPAFVNGVLSAIVDDLDS